METPTLASALEHASRAWLLFPDFRIYYNAQEAAYRAVFDAINKRTLITNLREVQCPLEIIVFCDGNPEGIEENFHQDWFALRQIAMAKVPFVLETRAPAIITDPHMEESGLYFMLNVGERRFEPFSQKSSAGQIKEFRACLLGKASSGLGVNFS